MSAAVAQYLRESKARITDPAKWCVGVEECKECALTAVYRDDSGQLIDDAVEALNQAALAMHADLYESNLEPAAALNDTYGHAAVMRMYDLAIESEEGLS